MSKQLLSGVSQFVLKTVLVGCLSALAVPATSLAAGPSFDSAVCTVQSVNVPMLPTSSAATAA